jgi:hypothetical protein
MNTVPLTDRGYAIPNDELRDLVSLSAAVAANDDANLDKTCVNVLTPKPHQPTMVRQLGRYEVVRKLGEGGMGAVFLARDTATGEQVALKVLSDACLKQPGAFERFEKEARLLEEAHNPHIANMLDLGSDGDTRFLVMEFVDGCDLRRWLDIAVNSTRQRLLISSAICVGRSHRSILAAWSIATSSPRTSC